MNQTRHSIGLGGKRAKTMVVRAAPTEYAFL